MKRLSYIALITVTLICRVSFAIDTMCSQDWLGRLNKSFNDVASQKLPLVIDRSLLKEQDLLLGLLVHNHLTDGDLPKAGALISTAQKLFESNEHVLLHYADEHKKNPDNDTVLGNGMISNDLRVALRIWLQCARETLGSQIESTTNALPTTQPAAPLITR